MSPIVNLTSYKSIFSSLELIDKFIIIENEYDNEFFIGKIVNIKRNYLEMRIFDVDGIWQDSEEKILYSKIPCIK